MAAFPLRLSCPQCKAEVYAKRDQIGQIITCPECLEEFPVRDPALAPVPVKCARGEPQTGRLGDEDLLLQPDEDRPEVGGVAPTSPLPLQWGAAAGGGADDVGEDFEFDVECRVCGTRQDATSKQISRRIRCPDCYSIFVVQAPPPRARRKRTLATPKSADEVRLGEAVEAKPYRDLARQMLETAAKEMAPPDVPRECARQALRRGEKQATGEELARQRLPDRPLTSGVLGCLLEPSTASRCVVFAVLLQLELGVIATAARLFFQDSVVSQVFCMLLVIFSVVCGVMLFVAWSVNMLAIVQETAAGKDRIDVWPAPPFSEWFLESLHVVVALLASVVAAAIAGQILLPLAGRAQAVYLWGLTICLAVTVLAVFPVALLSSLEAGSPVHLVSRPVWRSLRVARRRWIEFWMMSVGLAAIAGVVFEGRRFGSIAVNFLVSVLIVFVSMLYFRLLGRVAWCCQEAVAKEECRRQEPGKEGGRA